MTPGLDHVGLDVSDYAASKEFYEKALAPLGMKLMMEPAPNVGGFGADFPFFWIAQRDRGPDSGVHVAFRVEDRETDYGAFVLDPDGNNVEAVCHKPA
jgi:catechol 2,3-dioxygenase-like lactoylglutathione lyase family enzyme